MLSVSCRAIAQLWTAHCLEFSGAERVSSPMYSYSAAIGDTIVDSFIFALPIPYVWRRLSKLKTRLIVGLVVVFRFGFSVCVVALLQIPFIRRRVDTSTYFGGTINLLVTIQISLAIVAAPLPDLRALAARNFPNFSPLHHRSLVTAREEGRRGGEQNRQSGMDEAKRGFEAARIIQKPGWLRESLPASLMETRLTETECATVHSRTLSRGDLGLSGRANG